MKKKAVKCDKLSREEEIIRIYTEMTQVLKLVDQNIKTYYKYAQEIKKIVLQ